MTDEVKKFWLEAEPYLRGMLAAKGFERKEIDNVVEGTKRRCAEMPACVNLEFPSSVEAKEREEVTSQVASMYFAVVGFFVGELMAAQAEIASGRVKR